MVGGKPKNTKNSQGRQPKYQNAFAFKHNPKSKLTEKILSSPNTGLCRRCRDKIEWRKQYRKYKPLTQPSTCTICSKRNINMAYHTICTNCSFSQEARERLISAASAAGERIEVGTHDKVCEMCTKEIALKIDSCESLEMDELISKEKEKLKDELQRPLKLREEKAVERKIERMLEKEALRKKAERRAAREGIIDEANDTDLVQEELEGEKEHRSNGDEPFDQGEGPLDHSHHDWGSDLAHSDNDNCDHEKYDEDDGPLDHSHHDWGSDLDHSDGDSGACEKALNHAAHEEYDEDDPFLKAIGGKSKLLVGEAYRNMLLEKERLSKMNISNPN